MLCPLCHTLNRDNAKFCKGCGRVLLPEDVADNSNASVPASTIPIEVPSASPVQQGGEAQIPPPPEQVAPVAQESANVDATAAPIADAVPSQSQAVQEQIGEPVEAVNDVSLAPTQILSPDRMVAYQAKRWQEELEREQQQSQGKPAAMRSHYANDMADAPTVAVSSSAAAQEALPGARQRDIADMPTILFSPGEYASVPPPPPPQSEVQEVVSPSEPGVHEQPSSSADVPYQTPEQTASPKEAGAAGPVSQEIQAHGGADQMISPEGANAANVPASSPVIEKSDVMEQTPSVSSDQSDQAQPTAPTEASTGDFPVIETGTTVAGRYEVTQLLSTENSEHVYQVVDQQGYRHCWNCGSEENAEDDKFCIACGAELLNASYIMHEFPAAENGSKEASVLQESIVNTFVDQGHTYVITQPQATASAFPNGVHLLAASDSDAGDVRRSEPNEDSTLVLQLERVHESVASPVGVFIVADGMGGHENGQGASRMTIGTIAERMVRELLETPLSTEAKGEEPKALDENALVGLLQGAVEDANAAICNLNKQNDTDMGSTITGFMIAGDHSYILNVGDSRTYMLRDNTLYQLTNDHSLVGQLVAGGFITADEVYTDPRRSQIYRSLGDKFNVQIDIFKQQIQPGDKLLSCSDGLWEMIRNPQITEILTNATDPQMACTKLIEAANANGGEDNVSAVIVFVR